MIQWSENSCEERSSFTHVRDRQSRNLRSIHICSSVLIIIIMVLMVTVYFQFGLSSRVIVINS